MQYIKNILGKSIANCCYKYNFHHHNIILDWAEIVGADLSALMQPAALNFPFKRTVNGTISLYIMNPAYILQIQAQKYQILQKINGYIGYNAVSEMQFIYKPGLMEKNEPMLSKDLREIRQKNAAKLSDSIHCEDAIAESSLENNPRNLYYFEFNMQENLQLMEKLCEMKKIF